ncbi:MAG: CdaR family protein [Bulleidia sp.]|nr:CdaR family protein [Bulleidia sp.]
MNRNDEVKDMEERSDSSKTELANRIANQSRRASNAYQSLGNGAARMIRWFSTLLDKTLFNTKYPKIVSLILAVILYLVANYNSQSSLYTTTLNSSRDLTNVSVTAKYNADTFELSGLPSSADVTIVGGANAVTAAAASNGVIVADLEGLTEGTHQVNLEGEGYGDNVSLKINPSNAIITLKKKTTQQFDLSYDYINKDKMDSVYSVGTPTFSSTRVNVRASKDTLSTISFVKALIDVSGQSADFEQDALLVAYDSQGQPVNADIFPKTVHVSVPVTSPNKTVPIEVEVSGSVPDGQAIAGISMDQQTVTIYGPESVLGQIDKVVVTLNASSITKDSTIMRPITLPTGVNSSNINQITMTVTLGEASSRQIDDVPIYYRNNVNNYKASSPDNKTTTSVIVTGTEDNIAGITADDIRVYVDMKDAVAGLQDFPLEVDQPSGGLVKYTLTESTYTLNVLGVSNDDANTDEGTGVNNG